MNNNLTLDELIWDFCSRILGDFRNLKNKFQQLHPEWSEPELAVNLMEFGRGLISGVDEPSDKDLQLMPKYVGSLSFENPEAALFVAYAGGCIMGLIQAKQLSGEDFIEALKMSAHFAQSEFGEKG